MGSSPRMRGKRECGRLYRPHPGLIPAHAGKTDVSQSLRRAARAHPRACGENLSGRDAGCHDDGSSPRMRGKLRGSVATALRGGLIPAHAGKTVHLDVEGQRRGAHPRACGENCPSGVQATSVAGSSPRMRGKLPIIVRALLATGLIPAHAGKTPGLCPARFLPGAHPRACGENGAENSDKDVVTGSSPRMRGKLERWHDAGQEPGLIPAHAGKTTPYHDRIPRRPAHPRACGENFWQDCPRVGQGGSSPRMRGKHHRGATIRTDGGLIPAHAGKTATAKDRATDALAHPRACGENIPTRSPARPAGGSSPRMRGKRAVGASLT